MFKKLFKGLFVLCALLFMNMPANAFYTDMDESHWCYQSIKFLTEIGVLVGYPDGTYKPDIPVSRAEFASMVIKSLGQENANITQPIDYADIEPDFWGYNIIQKAVYFDLIIGFECKNREEVKNEIEKKLKEKYSEYNFYVIIDDDITD